ncbi:putative glucuronosyltransferase [Capsicum baccatum]|uniref:Glucuronosyltransferase n=1 Tax=Capsicum baccatum TaxID=33114 RepID=A0A2G2X605_CAPBA|nr:putative glucuronosyltransferase [Capsicum baccatum]
MLPKCCEETTKETKRVTMEEKTIERGILPLLQSATLVQTFGQQNHVCLKDGSITIPPYAPPQKMHDYTNALRYDQRHGDNYFLSKGSNWYCGRDVAFPKGKENLASVIRCYKHRLSNKPVENQEAGGAAVVPSSF